MNNFFNTLGKFFAPPVFEGDEEKTRAAELVNTILISLTGVLVLALIGVLVGSKVTQAIIAVSVALLLLITLQIPLRRGYVKPVAITIVFLLTILVSYTTIVGGTVRAPAIVGLVLASIIAGLTINRQAAYWSTVSNILIYSGLAYGEIHHLLPVVGRTARSPHRRRRPASSWSRYQCRCRAAARASAP